MKMTSDVEVVAACVAVQEKPTFTYRFAVQRENRRDVKVLPEFPFDLMALDACFFDSRFDAIRAGDSVQNRKAHGNETRITLRTVKTVSPWSPDPAWAERGWVPVKLSPTAAFKEGLMMPPFEESKPKTIAGAGKNLSTAAKVIEATTPTLDPANPGIVVEVPEPTKATLPPANPWPSLMKPVTSSNIARIGYLANPTNKALGRLRVEFTTGSTYEYENVRPEIASEFLAAKSIGGFFAAKIKGNKEFPYRKV